LEVHAMVASTLSFVLGIVAPLSLAAWFLIAA
jgi:hypothetical protein